MAITRRQKEVLDFISNFVQSNGYSPSYEEIARGLELKSLATVHKHVTNLQNKGLIARAHNRSRSLDVLPPRSRTRTADRLPLMGRIAAGMPVEAAENPETISLGDIIGNREVFALQVRGESMRDEHIVDGDYVLVERTSTARQGEIIVALVRGAETTLKRFYLEGSMVRLQPSNAEMNPIIIPAATHAPSTPPHRSMRIFRTSVARYGTIPSTATYFNDAVRNSRQAIVANATGSCRLKASAKYSSANTKSKPRCPRVLWGMIPEKNAIEQRVFTSSTA